MSDGVEDTNASITADFPQLGFVGALDPVIRDSDAPFTVDGAAYLVHDIAFLHTHGWRVLLTPGDRQECGLYALAMALAAFQNSEEIAEVRRLGGAPRKGDECCLRSDPRFVPGNRALERISQ